MSLDDRHPVDLLAEEYADRISSGQNPSIEEYTSKYPEHADLIRSVFPSIAIVQRVSDRADQQHQSDSKSAIVFGKQGVPESLGDFQLVREIGRGGMGVVYEAIQLSLKRHVALKVIGAIPSGSEKQLARFRREAEAAASLHHTHIVPVFGIGEDQGLQYYAMQLIDGVTLGDVVRFLQGDRPLRSEAANQTASRATFSTAAAVNLLLNSLATPDPFIRTKGVDSAVTKEASAGIAMTNPPSPSLKEEGIEVSRGSIEALLPDSFIQHHYSDPHPLGKSYYQNVAQLVANVADALQYAHHQGVLHRDIKPSNLLLDRDGIVWITDFGLARRTDCEGMTQTGEIVGTLRYMAPEQMRGQADQRTDVYSLGLTLFELLTLQPAIEQPQNRLYQSGTEQAVAKMHSLFPEIPADLQTITLKACAAEPNHRYQTAAEFEEDLRRFTEDRPILARRTTRMERLYRWARRNPTVASLTSATLVLLVAIASLLAIFNQRKQVALNAISNQFNRAERNLKEKTAALETVEIERARAEFNLDLAIQAFDAVISNIASRGGSDSILNDLTEDGEIISLADATLSDADVVLLETLLGFFDRFSAENEKDLSGKSADARLKVGDIQQRLGRLDDAERSYRLALDAFQSISNRNSDNSSSIYVQAEILNNLLVVAAKKGQMPVAFNYYEEALGLLEKFDGIRNSTDGRFALAKTHNNLAAIGSKFNRGPMLRPRGLLGNRPPPKPFDDPMAIMQKFRLQREATANTEAIQLLKDLISEFQDTVVYQVSYARALRDEVRIAGMMEDRKRADESLSKAIQIFEQLGKQYPESRAFKYELASSLSMSIATRPNESRFLRSMKLCDDLIVAHPNVAEYRALRGQTLEKIANMLFSSGKNDRAEVSLREAIEIETTLADQYPDVLLYQINLFQSIQRMIEMHSELKRPDLVKQDIALALARFEKLKGQNRLVGPMQQMVARLRDRQRMLENASKE